MVGDVQHVVPHENGQEGISNVRERRVERRGGRSGINFLVKGVLRILSEDLGHSSDSNAI